jgi:hypothetical protein
MPSRVYFHLAEPHHELVILDKIRTQNANLRALITTWRKNLHNHRWSNGACREEEKKKWGEKRFSLSYNLPEPVFMVI